MAVIKWGPEYSVGVDAIDRQHRQLVNLINDFYSAMADRRTKEKLQEAVDRMAKYALDHFGLEERYMEERKYPEYKRHCEEHKHFASKTLELQDRLGRDGLVLSLEVSGYLRDWLVNHILNTDKRLGEFLNTQWIQ